MLAFPSNHYKVLDGLIKAAVLFSAYYYPVTNGGDKAEIEDGKVVLVKGVAGLSRNVDPDETGIDAVVWQDWRLGYGDVTVHFNEEDLTVIYWC